MSKYKRRRVKLKDHTTQGARRSKGEAWLRKQLRRRTVYETQGRKKTA